MKYIPTPSTFVKTAQQLAEYIRGELQRISSSIGSIEQEGWTDLRFPVQGINPAGSPAPPAVDDTISANAVTGTLLFSGSLENVIAGIAQLPHGIVSGPGAIIEPHIHWCSPTALGDIEAVKWKFYYKVIGNPTAQPEAWVGPVSGTVVAGTPTVAYEHCISTFTNIPLTSLYDSAIIAWRVHREGQSDSATTVARLFEFDFHMRVRSFGSPDIYARKA